MTRLIRTLKGRLRHDEAGFTIVELIAAVGIMAIGFFALTGTFHAGARLLVQSRQRQVAVEEAQAKLEHLRNIDYDNAALDTQPSFEADPDHPDHDVSTDGTGYDYTGGGTFEPLVVDTADGAIPHVEGPNTVGPTTVTVYQYITWIDDPVGGDTTEDYKRATVVVTYSASANPGRPHSVQVSALVTKGSVTILGSTAGASTGSPTATATSTPTATPSGTCAGDVDAPTGVFSILSGTGATTGFTASTTATLSLAPVDGCEPIQAQFSNDDTTYSSWVTYDAVNSTVSWTLTSGDGLKSVWAHFKDGNDNQTTVGPHTITLDATLPTTPTSFSATVSCSGNDRTASFSWGASTDTNLLGYRLSRQINGGGYGVVATTAATTGSNTHLKTNDSTQFYVRAYDKAGNEGVATSVIALAKNQCS